MQRQEIVAMFNLQHAASYDQHGVRLAPLRAALHHLIDALLAEVRGDARVLCVGAGTGHEILELARRHPGWTFTAVEPAGPMLEVCRANAAAAGIAERCTFHEGYLDTLQPSEPFDIATSLLVSQFVLGRTARTEFFRQIAARLVPAASPQGGGWLINADLAADTHSAEYQALSELWWRIMRTPDAPPEGLEKMRAAYRDRVGILPPDEVAKLIAAAGFAPPVQFFQAGLLCGWWTRRGDTV